MIYSTSTGNLIKISVHSLTLLPCEIISCLDLFIYCESLMKATATKKQQQLNSSSAPSGMKAKIKHSYIPVS